MQVQLPLSSLLTRWLKGPVHTMLPEWVLRLIPHRHLHAAALAGTQETPDFGQVSLYKPYSMVALRFYTLQEAQAFEDFADRAYVSSPATILRSCIMLGMQLPRIKEGVMSPTRQEPLSAEELITMQRKAKQVQS